MTKSFAKYVASVTVLLCLIIIIKTCTPENENKNSKLLEIIKRNLVSKELEYFKTNPMSNEMQKFIRRYKRKIKNNGNKIKRDKEIDKNHMYVVQQGEIMPLSDLESPTTEEEPRPIGNFTVIPLIIPITVETFKNHTPPVIDDDTTEEETPYTERQTTCRRHTVEPETKIYFPVKEVDVDTNEVAKTPKDGKLLSKVLQDVQQLLNYENEMKSGQESTLCNVSGDWDSFAGGMQIRIEFRNESHIPQVKAVDREPPMEGFLTTARWHISGIVPFNYSSVIVLTAISRKCKKVATFIGECRICEGDETISGNWMMGRSSRSCKDREETHSFFSDVMRRNNVRKLQQAHLEQLTSTSSDQDDNY